MGMDLSLTAFRPLMRFWRYVPLRVGREPNMSSESRLVSAGSEWAGIRVMLSMVRRDRACVLEMIDESRRSSHLSWFMYAAVHEEEASR